MSAWEDSDVRKLQSVLLPNDTPSERFGPLAGFVEIWRAKRTGGRLPAWSDFDFYDFVGWHGLVYVDEVVARDPIDLRCRLWGTRLVELLGSEETGKLFSESVVGSDPKRVADNVRLVRDGLICFVTGWTAIWGRQLSLSVVKLPCADDGIRVDHVLGAVWPDAPFNR